jgi:hypothetical protein
MKIYVSHYLLFFFALSILISCQHNSYQTEYFSNIEKNSLEQEQELEGLSENHNHIDLSLSTLKQQNIEKEKAAKKLEDARKERIEIEVENSTNYSEYVNVARFARDTKNKKGEKIYTRLSLTIYDNWNECSKFKTKDEAQRKFLKDGGPYKDRFNLDPDGDGFACEWDPEIYRELSIPNN